jgi:PAS domain S-box-containing protein
METLLLERTAAILRGRNRILRELVDGAPLERIFTVMTQAAEAVIPGMRCSILRLDAEHGVLRHGAAPSLPDEYNEIVDGLPVGPGAGSCGAAAHGGERVVAEDTLTHPNWANYQSLVERFGLRSCWSEPIKSPSGEVLGTLAMYHDEPSTPGPFEIEFIVTNAQVAAYAIEHDRDRRELLRLQAQLRQIIDLDPHMIFAKDEEGRFLLANRAMAKAYGSSNPEELTGQRHADLQPVPEEARRMLADDAEVMQSGHSKFIAEETFVDSDGVKRVLQTIKIPFTSAGTDRPAVLGVAVDISERKRAEERLERALEELEERRRSQVESMTAELLLAEERERRSLAVDLHDGLNQIVTLARMKLAALRGQLEGPAQEAVQEVEALVEQANRSARSLTFQLSPPILHDLGFEAALQWLAEEIEETHGLCVELTEHGAPAALGEDLRVLLFRAVRELLINVAKHAEASRVTVHTDVLDDEIRIRVEDDGAAFDPASVDATRSMGLSSIRERLTNLGGSMRIESKPGSGTCITVVAPLAGAEETP